MSEQAKRPGPPPMPKAKPPAEPELSVESSGPPPISAPPPVKREADRIMEPLPNALTILLVGVGVVVLAGLIIPDSAIITVPILSMIGIWVASFGYRIQSTMPKGMFGMKSVKHLYSPLGWFTTQIISLGMAPLALIFIGLPMVMAKSGAGGFSTDERIRFILIFFAIVMIPSALLTLAKTKRQLEKVNRHDG